MMSASTMTLDRLRELLDAYGASPERWPPAERSAAAALLSESNAARGLRDEAARLDALLDLVPARQPSHQLIERALAGAPNDPRQARWRRVAIVAVPLAAAAAAVVVWLMPQRQPANTPETPQYAIEDLGVYTTPTDVLLDLPGFDLSASAPVVGCVDNGLGCPLTDTGEDRQSRLPDADRRDA
jgi:hypothetical protein